MRIWGVAQDVQGIGKSTGPELSQLHYSAPVETPKIYETIGSEAYSRRVGRSPRTRIRCQDDEGMKGLFDLAQECSQAGASSVLTLLIVGGSVFSMTGWSTKSSQCERVITGSGSTTQTGLNPAPGQFLICSLCSPHSVSVCSVLREVFRGSGNRKSSGQRIIATDSVSLPLKLVHHYKCRQCRETGRNLPRKKRAKALGVLVRL